MDWQLCLKPASARPQDLYELNLNAAPAPLCKITEKMDGWKVGKRVKKNRMKTRGKKDDGEADPQKHNERLYLLPFRWSFSKLIVASCLVFTVKCTVCRIQGGLLLAC